MAGYFDHLDEERRRAAPRVPPSQPAGPGQNAYAAAALQSEAAAIAALGEGTRNQDLNKSWFKMGQHVAAGSIHVDTVRATLADAARTAGLPEHEIAKVLRDGPTSALGAAADHPRHPAPRDSAGAPGATPLVGMAEPQTDGVPTDPATAWQTRLVSGGSFVLDVAEDPEPLWGRGTDVLLADGEALIIAGGQGLGKSTIGQQLALGRAGIAGYDELLGYPVTAGAGRVLYLAMDRPRQIARSLHRMVGPQHRASLDERVRVWQGPPPYDLARYPALLTQMAKEAGADTVVVDSLKDAAIGLVDDEVGSGWQRARQAALVEGVQMIELHHNRKRQQQGKQASAAAYSLDDLYGSTWITSGAGSILLLVGSPGDLVVNVHHLKQPAEVVGPLTVVHDHQAGRTTIRERADLVALARVSVTGLTPRHAAQVRCEVDKPTNAQVQAARRSLDKLVASGQLTVLAEGNHHLGEARRYGAA